MHQAHTKGKGNKRQTSNLIVSVSTKHTLKLTHSQNTKKRAITIDKSKHIISLQVMEPTLCAH